jgi:hypothetical protein
MHLSFPASFEMKERSSFRIADSIFNVDVIVCGIQEKRMMGHCPEKAERKAQTKTHTKKEEKQLFGLTHST